MIPSGGTPPYTYLWSNASTDSCITVSPPVGTYTYSVIVTDSKGCITSCEAKLVVEACEGCTFTMGGWGAPCPESQAGDRYSTQPGCVRDHYFSQVFPHGVWIGNPAALPLAGPGAMGTQLGVESIGSSSAADQAAGESMTEPAGMAAADLDAGALTRTPSSAPTSGWYWALWMNEGYVQSFLPPQASSGGPGYLAQNWVNPETTTAHVLAGQLLALRMNVEYSCAGIFDSVGLVLGTYCYGNYTIESDCGKGKFDGMTVNTFLAVADSAVGGLDVLGSYSASFSDLNVTADCLNRLFSDCDPYAPFVTWEAAGAKTPADQGSSLPEDFSVSQNYPNPFNPICNIDYALPTDCQVNLAVYNVLGQRVKLLVDEYQSAGYRSVTWDGTNEQGQEMATGVYFYRIQAGDFIQSKKMLLMK